MGHRHPAPAGSAWRRTTSLSISMPKSCEICWAMRTQPNFGLRRFISTMTATSSGEGPGGPGLRCEREWLEKSKRYLQSTSALWNLNNVAGLRMAESFGMRGALMNCVNIPSVTRSSVVRFGARCRERLVIRSWCLSSSDSAMTARTPPGRRSLATVTRR